MKKMISLLASAAVLTQALPIYASAASYNAGGTVITYTESSSGITITDCTSESKSLAIPDTIDDIPVTKIAAKAFSDCSVIVNVTIPDSVESIGSRAFYNCESLKNVSIGVGTQSVGDYAFSACPSLEKFNVDDGNTEFSDINGMLFDKTGSTLLAYAGSADAVIPDGAEFVGKAAFFGNSKLKSVDLNNVTSIDDYAFSACFSLPSITLPDSIVSVGKGSFMNCTQLAKVTLGSGITEIPDDCFSMCTRLQPFEIGSSVKEIGSYAFYSCNALSGIEIPATVKSLGSNSVGTHYSLPDGSDKAIRGFFISGKTGSAAEKYADANKVEFLDFDNIPYGDVDGDNAVDSADASAVLTEYAVIATGGNKTFTYYQTITGDYDCDGTINSADASRILTVYAENATKR